MAKQLFLAAELRCDLNRLQLDTPEGGNKKNFLEMENNEAEQYLRQSCAVRTDYGMRAIRFNDNF